jgi:hypothetical protein
MSRRETEREEEQMIKVNIVVHSGTARFGVAVQAESPERALSLVAGRYPARPCRVRSPLEARELFAARAGTRPEKLAA